VTHQHMMYAVILLGKNINTIKIQHFGQQYGDSRTECRQNHYYHLRSSKSPKGRMKS